MARTCESTLTKDGHPCEQVIKDHRSYCESGHFSPPGVRQEPSRRNQGLSAMTGMPAVEDLLGLDQRPAETWAVVNLSGGVVQGTTTDVHTKVIAVDFDELAEYSFNDSMVTDWFNDLIAVPESSKARTQARNFAQFIIEDLRDKHGNDLEAIELANEFEDLLKSPTPTHEDRYDYVVIDCTGGVEQFVIADSGVEAIIVDLDEVKRGDFSDGAGPLAEFWFSQLIAVPETSQAWSASRSLAQGILDELHDRTSDPEAMTLFGILSERANWLGQRDIAA